MSVHAAIPLLLLQTVWVVDDNGGPGVNFTDIQPAVDAAVDGDVVLVNPGTYNHFALSGKGLRVLGAGPNNTFVKAPFLPSSNLVTSLTNVPSGSLLYLSGLRFGEPSFTLPTNTCQRVVVSGSTTRAVLNDVVVVAPPGSDDPSFGGPPGPGLLVDGSEAYLVHCDINGLPGKPLPEGPNGSSGLEARSGARVHLVSSAITGGNGVGMSAPGCIGCVSSYPSGGGPGLLASSTGGLTWVWSADSVIRGGSGGVSGFSCGIPGPCMGTGGPGIQSVDARVRISGGPASLVQGGSGNGAGLGIQAFGSSSVVEVHSVAVVGGLVGPGITLDLPSLPVLALTGNPTLGTGSLSLSFSNGLPGAFFAIVVTGAPDFFGIPGPFLGEFVIALPFPPPFVSGALSPAGDFSLPIPLAGLPPSLAYASFHLQGALLDGGGVWRLSNGTSVTLVP